MLLSHSKKSYADWDALQFCPGCSRRQYSLWAGWKRACASSLGPGHASHESSFIKPLLIDGKSFADDGKGECATTNTLSNFSVSTPSRNCGIEVY